MSGSVEGKRYYFHPRSLFKYIWICLNQGHGVKAWGKEPPRPHGIAGLLEPLWYVETADEITREVLDKWTKGQTLDNQFPR